MMCSFDAFEDQESISRLIDAFVDSLDLTKYGVKEAAKEGSPSCDQKGMYKLYIYGGRKAIRSSRKLAENCKINCEVKWKLVGVEPDFRTISDFRKNNIDSLKDIFHEFNWRISETVEWGFASIVGGEIEGAQERLAQYEAYQELMEETGAAQLSMTDADARLQKCPRDSVCQSIRMEQ